MSNVATFAVIPPPDLLALHAANPDRYPCLLESVARGPHGRFDILFAFPEATLTLASDDTLHENGHAVGRGGFLDALDRTWHAEQTSDAAGVLPFSGGWFLFLGYELASEVEPVLVGLAPDSRLPRALAVRSRAAFVHDHDTQHTHLVWEPGVPEEWRVRMQLDARACTPEPERPVEIDALVEDDPRDYLTRVRRVQEYIAAGDVFQVNLARAWRARLKFPVSPAMLYRRLRAANPGPFAALMNLPQGCAIISSSPERLVEVRGRRVRTRPIAGTYPRASDPESDRVLADALLAHPKERAEHVMLIDLERNDLGRVCRPGTVRAREFMAIESYAHVHHIVSEIEGELRVDVTPGTVLRAIFPGGTITGCPKVRCMQIIQELERAPRGAYTGAVGYLNRNGGMDLNILIRTIVQHSTELTLHAGAGIVADSIPERELEETRAKARGMLAALGLT